ncbi:Uncharacterized protein Adt_21472 [Abeliophyllum distichum]|uniref:Uncharacterized protein n=1 Tax=Abeliophyllum distichum TaxID=126358 RepID=A0ABD1SZG1_9LAMI
MTRSLIWTFQCVWNNRGSEDPELRIDPEPTPLPSRARLDGLQRYYYLVFFPLGRVATNPCVVIQLKWIKGRHPRPTLARLTKQRPKTLVPGSAEYTSQRKAIEDLSRVGNKEVAEASKVIEVDDAPEVEVPLFRKRKARNIETGTSQVRGSAVEVVDNTVCSVPPFQRTLAVNTSGEVVFEGSSKSTPTPGSGDGGLFDSKRWLWELIGAPGAEDPGRRTSKPLFLSFHGSPGREEVLHSQVGRVFFSRRIGRCAGSQLGFSNKGLCNANEGFGRVQDTNARAEKTCCPSVEG